MLQSGKHQSETGNLDWLAGVLLNTTISDRLSSTTSPSIDQESVTPRPVQQNDGQTSTKPSHEPAGGS
ncbi:hypothetical protein BO71DRAFT_399137 [Aspergillus ellipticus CBS 707.79]|uniref:Uncharacterized protein n=1 Tax=Aspergillus ellipticus CBS 707.79 TaxID=1448320 RepID=A0A319D9K6_9EURO|nr:hypothetical protein BO71DRAFT_399137 [Aspergillus ellipticus CBS 707.79]